MPESEQTFPGGSDAVSGRFQHWGGDWLPPVSLLVKPASSMCNLRCGYCFYADVSDSRKEKSRGIMPDEVLEFLMRRAFQEASGSCSFSFQGGEPTLAGLDFFRRLTALQKQYNTKKLPVRNALQTNGLLLDDEWADFLAENSFLVGLSLDGGRELHDSMRKDADGGGTYARVMQAAGLLDRHGVEYNVLCVVHNAAARHPQQVYRALKRFRYLQFIPCLDPLDGSKPPHSLDPKRYGEFLKGTFDCYYADFFSKSPVSVRSFDNYAAMLAGCPPESCGMSGVCACCLTVEADGSVYPCDFYALDEYLLGNVRDNSLAEMARSEAAQRFIQPSLSVHEDCRSCGWYPLCRGGCRRNRPVCADGRPGKNELCDAYRAFFAYAYPRLLRCAAAFRTQGLR